MTDAEKAARLRQVMDLLEQAEDIVRQTLGDTDAGLNLHYEFDSLVESLMGEILELEGEV